MTHSTAHFVHAQALPCEMGPDGKPAAPRKQQQEKEGGWQQWMQPSRYEQIWARRVQAGKAQATSQDKQ